MVRTLNATIHPGSARLLRLELQSIYIKDQSRSETDKYAVCWVLRIVHLSFGVSSELSASFTGKTRQNSILWDAEIAGFAFRVQYR